MYRNLGTEPEFDVDGYPEHEVRFPSLDTSRMGWLTSSVCCSQYKYVTDGELAIVQDGKRVSAVVGDLVYIPAVRLFLASRRLPRWRLQASDVQGSSFRILPTIFTAV